MNTVGDPSLDPAAIASRSFTKSMRGFDQGEVKAYLRALSDALRSQERASGGETQSLEAAKRDVERLTAEVASLDRLLGDARSELDSGAGELVLDESTVSQYVGQETTRVLEAARRAAAEIVAGAEEQAEARTAEIDRIQTAANADVADLRRAADEEAAATRSAAAEEATSLQQSSSLEAADLVAAAEADSVATRASANEAATAVREEASAEASNTLSSAAAEASEIRTKAADDSASIRVKAEATKVEVIQSAEAIKAEAETEAARVRAEAEADSLASQEAARETARLMVVEAQSVREKVLADLVKRRRLGRQQLDQVKAARDRLHRSLAEVRGQLGDSFKELEASLPEAKAAMDAVVRQPAAVNETEQVRELEVELDAGRDGAGESPETPTKVSSGSAALASFESGEPDAADEPGEGDAGLDDIFARLREDGDDSPAAEEQVDEATPVDDGSDGADEGGEDEEESSIDLPEPFVKRDVAMTRHGVDLRRRIKRAMADDQSDILDRLRQAKKMSVSDLPDADDQRAAYLAAVGPALKATAKAGATMAGGKIAAAQTQVLIDRVAASIFEPLRARVEQSVGEVSDAEEVLEPVRAHYRDLRSSEIPSITDDALAEAFALGAYAALPENAAVKWIADPRMEPNPDCFDNTLADGVTKPEAFPTGRTYPTGEPGCRCLVVAVD